MQRLLADGQFTGTYKFALIMAIADICVARGCDSGGELEIQSTEIAEKMLGYYWGHSRPYQSDGVLRQNAGKKLVVLKVISDLQEASFSTLAQAQSAGKLWRAAVFQVAATVRGMPLWKLQTIGGLADEFLYENKPGSHSIRLRGGVMFCLRLFYPLVNDLARSRWTRWIRRQNSLILGPDSQLDEFLFGSERTSLVRIAEPLREIQEGRCFYCGKKLRKAHVDHFVPWIVYPVDLGHNFVLADAACNLNKSDHLPSVEHLLRWADRNRTSGESIAEMLAPLGMTCDLSTTAGVARWAYALAAVNGKQTWRQGRTLVPLGSEWKGVFEEAA